MVRCFVTGGAGFIGSHLVDRLLAEGNQVTAFDNLSSGQERWLQHHDGETNFAFVRGDLRDAETLNQTIQGHDVVWHLGANADIPGGKLQVDKDLTNNTIGTHNLLEAMRSAEIRELLFSSTSAVYGDPPVSPTPETAGPLLPISLYGAAKLACEGLISSYCHLFGIQAWIFRFANVVGSRMSRGVIHDFVHRLIRNTKELQVLGDGQGEKPFFLVEECIEGMLHAWKNTQGQCDVFNLGCTTTTRIDRVAEVVIEEMGLTKLSINYAGGRRGFPGDVPELYLDVSKMRALGWATQRTSDEAVRAAARRLIQEATSRETSVGPRTRLASAD